MRATPTILSAPSSRSQTPVTPTTPTTPVPWVHRGLLLVVLVTALIYIGVVALSVRHYHGNLSALIDAGDRSIGGYGHLIGHHVIIFRHTDGYDGLTYYFAADDPFLQRRVYHDVFRYQRIGYPVAVWAASLGQHALRPLAMVGVNIIAVLAVAYLSGLIILLWGKGTSVWWALACAVNPGLLIAVQGDLAEPLTIALSLWGLLLYMRQRIAWAALAFAAALLTREVAVLFIAPLVIAEVMARRWRGAVALVLAGVPYLLWQVILAATFGHVGAQGSQGNFTLPLVGIGAVITEAGHNSLRGALVHQGSILAVVVLVVATLVVALVQVRRRYDIVSGGLLAHGLAALFAGPGIWIAYTSAARVFGGIYPLTVFGFAQQRGRMFYLLVIANVLLTLFTFIRLIAISPTLPYYVTP